MTNPNYFITVQSAFGGKSRIYGEYDTEAEALAALDVRWQKSEHNVPDALPEDPAYNVPGSKKEQPVQQTDPMPWIAWHSGKVYAIWDERARQQILSGSTR